MPAALARTAWIGLVALVSLPVLAACGPGEGVSSARPSTTASFEPTRSVSPGESSGGGSSSGWWWLLLAVLVLGAGVGYFLIRRNRTVRVWDSRLSAATSDVGWFARDLVPALRRCGSAAGVAGGWAVAAPRITQLEDDLSALVTTAPGDERRVRAVATRDAVRVSRERMSALAGRAGAGWEAELDVVQEPLIAVLAPPEAPSPSAR